MTDLSSLLARARNLMRQHRKLSSFGRDTFDALLAVAEAAKHYDAVSSVSDGEYTCDQANKAYAAHEDLDSAFAALTAALTAALGENEYGPSGCRDLRPPAKPEKETK